jgi:L-rhamnose mutarotase
MERFAWKATIHEGKLKEYEKRHDKIWPEMKRLLKEAGICNYSIWSVGNEVFGYFECEKGVAYAEKYQADSPIVTKWNEYMKDVMTMDIDPVTGAQPKMRKVFYLK